jgi:hypothetical protein
MKNNLELMRVAEQPEVGVGELVGWQVQALELMKSNTKRVLDIDCCAAQEEPKCIPRLIVQSRFHEKKVHVVYNREGHTGRTTFLKAVKYDKMADFIIFQGVPNHQDFLAEMKHLERWGHTGYCIIFDIYRQYKHRDIYRTLEVASDNPNYHNIWVFTHWMPDISSISSQRWRIFTVTADFNKGMMSDLIPLSLDDARKIHSQEHS